MGGPAPGPSTDVRADTGALEAELSALRDPNSQEARSIQGLISGGLSPEARQAFQSQLQAIQGGTQEALQNAREQSAARGLFSSDIALGQETLALQNLAGQRAGVFGQQAQQIQGGILSGLQASQGRAGLRGQLAGQISSLRTGANQSSAQMAQSAFASQQQFGGSLAQAGGQIGAALLDPQTLTTVAGMFSDEILKDNIEPEENALEKIKQLNGKSWTWKKDGTKDHGVIAQELEKVFPELVIEEDGLKKVKYHSLIGVLIEAVKELSTKIKE